MDNAKYDVLLGFYQYFQTMRSPKGKSTTSVPSFRSIELQFNRLVINYDPRYPELGLKMAAVLHIEVIIPFDSNMCRRNLGIIDLPVLFSIRTEKKANCSR